MKKKLASLLLAAAMALTMTAFPVFAAGEEVQDSSTAITEVSGLCEHHPQHDESCGYTEGTEEIPCTHEHDGDCYQLVTECVHEHTAECYPVESVSENTATPSQPEEAEPTACTHECSEESGCITEVLDCKHEHDEACGYAPATEGTPCAFVCEVCNAQDSGDTATPSDAQPEECTCETLCTGDNINGACPVCEAEGAEPTACEGLEAQPATLSNALPATALAAAAQSEQQIFVGDVDMTSGGYWTTSDDGMTLTLVTSVTDSDHYIHYDAGNNILTLHNATIKTSNSYMNVNGSAIGAYNGSGDAELTIQLEGDNTIGNVSTGICVYSSSTVDAALNITGENGGSLTASGYANGIYVQSNNGDATLNIQGAVVEATVSSVAGQGVTVQAGEGKSTSLSVDGGSLTATGGSSSGLGIYFYGPSSSNINLDVSNSAIVRANGGIAAGINEDDPVTPSGVGIVFNDSQGTVYGSVELQENLTIGEGESLDIPSGTSLTIGSGATLTNEGTVTTEGGTLTNNGQIENSGTLPSDIKGTRRRALPQLPLLVVLWVRRTARPLRQVEREPLHRATVVIFPLV